VQEAFLREDWLPGVSAFFVTLAQLGRGSCLYRTYHKLVFAHVPLPLFRDFNLADYNYLPVSSEIKELFEYIKR